MRGNHHPNTYRDLSLAPLLFKKETDIEGERKGRRRGRKRIKHKSRMDNGRQMGCKESYRALG